MVANCRLWLVATILGITASQAAYAQAPVPTMPATPIAANYNSAPPPLPPAYSATLGTPLPPSPPPGAYGAPPPSPYYQPAPLFAPADPGRDGWGPFGLPSALPSLFFDFELYFLQPSIKGTLHGDMPLPGGGTKTFSTPGTGLDFTVSPRIKAGWRLPDSTGEFSFSYRFIATDGRGNVASPFGTLADRTRLNMNIFDFDYASARFAFAPRWNFQWRLGVRLETVFYDNQGTVGIFSEKASNYFVGAGPHAGLEVDREIAVVPGLSVFAKADGAVAIGQVRQKFSETVGGPGGPFISNFEQDRTQSSPNLTVQAGVNYCPPFMPYWNFFGGFQYERFWEVGKVGGSTGDVQDYGGFVGAKFDF